MKLLIIPVFAAALLLPTSIASADAAANYKKKCASCHGTDGSGKTRAGKKAGARDYTTADGQKWSDSEGAKAIKDGVKKNGKEVMKAYGDIYSSADIKALVQYIRAFKK